jgi:hemoglobin-like flavoprotein
MTPNEIQLVQTSFAKVAPVAEKAAVMFYNRLFEIDPSLRALFKGDMVEQGKRLMAMVAVAVNGLNHIEDLVPAVQDLGRRHAGYGVQEQHYATVGGALLEMLETALGNSFTPEVKAAWDSVYRVLSSTMIEAANNTGNDQQAVA